MRKRFLPPMLLTLLVGLVFAAGCNDDATSRSTLTLVEINQNQTLKSDVVTGGQTIYEDEVPITIRSDPADDVVDLGLGSPYSATTIERYRIQFECGEQIPDVEGSLGWTVRSRGEVTGSLVVVPAALKVEPVLYGLRQQGEILATARITIFGREAVSHREVRLEVAMPVHFANWQDP